MSASVTASKPVSPLYRWRMVAAALVMQVCLGALYAWSVFRTPLAQVYGWTAAETIAPYRYSLLCLTIGMVVGGYLQDRRGPRLTATIGGLMMGAGCMLAALIGNTPGGLVLAYGIVGGLGVGFAYGTPIATCIRWFPDRRGFITGLAVMGFGAGSLVFGPLLEALIGADRSQFAVTIPRTFLAMGVLFLTVVIAAARVFHLPEPGYAPAGWRTSGAKAEATGVGPAGMLRTWQFFAGWLVYFLGSSIGLTGIGEAIPMFQSVAKGQLTVPAGTLLGFVALCNGLGRLFWASLSDYVGRRAALLTMCGIAAASCLIVLRDPSTLNAAVMALCAATFCFGGFLSIMPALTADYWGSAKVGSNYGLMVSAYGLAGFFVPRYFAGVMDAARRAGSAASGYEHLFEVLGVFAIGGGLLAALLRRPRLD